MYRLFVLRNDKSGCFGGHALISLWALLLCSGNGALAQSTAPPVRPNAPFSIRATHLLGLPNTKNNCKGTLSIQDDMLRFQQDGKPGAEVNIASVRAVSGQREQAGRRNASEGRESSGSVRKWTSR